MARALRSARTAIEKVGKIDRPAIIKELQTGTFDTVIGKIKLAENNMPVKTFPLIGQWQNGFFTGVAPAGSRHGGGGRAEAGVEELVLPGAGSDGWSRPAGNEQ